MHAVLLTFQLAGSSTYTSSMFQEYEQFASQYPGMATTMKLRDGSRSGYLHVLKSEQTAERYLASVDFRRLTAELEVSDFYIHQYEMATIAVEPPAEISQTRDYSHLTAQAS